MCGRYGRRGDKQRIAECMQTRNTNVFDKIDDTYLAPSYNVAPQSLQPVLGLLILWIFSLHKHRINSGCCKRLTKNKQLWIFLTKL